MITQVALQTYIQLTIDPNLTKSSKPLKKLALRYEHFSSIIDLTVNSAPRRSRTQNKIPS